MSSKKEQRRLAIEREKNRRSQEIAEACPISRDDYEAMVNFVSDTLVERGHEHDFSVTTAYLAERMLPVESTLSFLVERRIKDDWCLLVDGDAHNFFGSSSDRLVRMPLEEKQLMELVEWVDSKIQLHGCDHSHKITRSWLEQNNIAPTRTIGALMALGGFCDCEVAMNVEPENVYP